MADFTSYFLMKEQDVIKYAMEKFDFFTDAKNLQCQEIGDGNLNYVFRVKDNATGKSVIVKQAGHTARISSDIVLSTNRIKIESTALKIEGKYAPGRVPEVYFFDEVMSCFAMEDLGDYQILREALMNYEIFPNFVDHITTFMAQTLLRTTDIVLHPKEKKELMQQFINPELCEISEDLVYTEPYYNQNNRNEVLSENKMFVQKLLYNNTALRVAVAKLKHSFTTNAQSLIHGDLHTGSIFITKEDTKIIDPEFSFYGPMGYDIGNVVANLIFAWVNGCVHEQKEFSAWIGETIEEVIDQFQVKFNDTWDEYATDLFAKETLVKEEYLASVLDDTAGIAGLEIIRRIVGLAKVKDITSIEDRVKRVKAERICLFAAEDFIMNRHNYKTGKAYMKTLESMMKNLEVFQ